MRFLNRNNEPLINDVIYLNTEKQGIPIECAIMYNTGYRENLHSYVNNINTIEGGTHEAGFRMALTRVLKKICRRHQRQGPSKKPRWKFREKISEKDSSPSSR